jgi:hypothetical protein
MRSILLGLLALALTKSVLAEPPTLEPAFRTSPNASSLSDYRAWSEAPLAAASANEGVQRQAARMQAIGTCQHRWGFAEESGATPPASSEPSC